MRENVPLLKFNDLRRAPGAIQREHQWPEWRTWILLSDGYLRAGSTNTRCGDDVGPGRRYPLSLAKSPDGAIQWPRIGKKDWLRRFS
jgi:hypothetical protein